ncbi:MAG TPA: SIS domain-containing protein [Polyangiaceae bacterium]
MLVKTGIQVLALDVDGVFTDGRAYLTRDGEQQKSLAFRDLDALGRARAAGLSIALVTGESGELVDVLAARIGADRVVAGAKDKCAALERLSQELGVALSHFCFVGDSDRDALAFPKVGFSMTPADGSRKARALAQRVLVSAGGAGAVEEAVEVVLASRETAKRSFVRETRLRQIVEESVAAHEALLEMGVASLAQIASTFIAALRAGNKLLFCGNGGSAADAQHVAAEFVGRFALERDPLPAIALTTDTSILTAVGNDWEFKEVFARQVRALARVGDVVIGISTSGRSPNVLRALEAARERGAITVAFTGAKPGPIARAADLCFFAPSESTPRVQELHVLGWHGVCELVEASLARPERDSLLPTGT